MAICQYMFNPFLFGDNVQCGLAEGHKGEHLAMGVAHSTALGAIQQVMDCEQWSPDTLDEIATILEQVGFPVREVQHG